jgi:hypothetical protein
MQYNFNYFFKGDDGNELYQMSRDDLAKQEKTIFSELKPLYSTQKNSPNNQCFQENSLFTGQLIESL